jgi:hypothetical protein
MPSGMAALVRKTSSAHRPSVLITEDRFKIRERILIVAGKLNDKDTKVTAAKELREAVQVREMLRWSLTLYESYQQKPNTYRGLALLQKSYQ